ncbi:MAG: InlB B-repeat-containing protein [Clostridia bacterium]|nr:InlB B-repeat-containing protein [Clostridia bacterium]
MKRIMCLMVVILLVFAYVDNSSIVFAKTTKTAEEALSWVQSKEGECVGDGECVALIWQYYKELGYTSPGGYGNQYATNKIPEGFGWRKKGGIPNPGDILIYQNGQYGHVAIYESSNVTWHQRYPSDYYKVKRVEGNYNTIVSDYWGCIHVNFSDSSSIHTHSWKTSANTAHPHLEYKYCTSCNDEQYTGNRSTVKSCAECYPVGNVNLTRSFNRTSGETVFYRNSVTNATSYSLKIYRSTSDISGTYSLYSTQNMSSSSLAISLGQGYYYYATLDAINSNTGKTRSTTCDSFRIYNSYTVSYNANGGTNAPASQIKIQDENLMLSSVVPTRSHYIFKGWATSRNSLDVQYTAGSAYTKNAKATLYAVWEPETYDITFDLNGGKGTVNSTTIVYGDSLRMPNSIIREGYYLRGWSTGKSSAEPEFKLGKDYELTSNMTLYAIWGASNWGGSVATGFSGGDGSEADPYRISNASELAYLASIVNSQTSAPEYKYYILTDNINLNYEEWLPIGLNELEHQYFCGSFDGNGYTISDLSITSANHGYIGLFGYAKNSEIKNLTVAGEIYGLSTSDVLCAGSFVGFSYNTSFEKCRAFYVNMSDLSAGNSTLSSIGCIVGYADGGKINECCAENSYIFLKQGSFNAGLIAGSVNCGIVNCSVESEADELFGTAATAGNINMGGIVGESYSIIEMCSVDAAYFSNTVKSSNYNVGGIVGHGAGIIKLCSVSFDNGLTKNIGNISYLSSIGVSGESGTVGGIVGCSDANSQIFDCKYDGQSISATSSLGTVSVGGLAGNVISGDKIIVPSGQTLSRLYLPKMRGYTATWYTDSKFTHKYDFSQPVTDNISLYAKWESGHDELLSIWDNTSSQPYYDESTKTYLITKPSELAWISDVTNGVITSGSVYPEKSSFEGYCIKLSNDIYLNDTDDWKNWNIKSPSNLWRIIGANEENAFAGTFDGQGYSIIGMYINNENSSALGLFGYSNGTIKNLSIRESYGYGDTIGMFVGCNNGLVANCYNYGNLIAITGAGGIIAINYGRVELSFNYGDIISDGGGEIVSSGAGGIAYISEYIDDENDGTIYNCANYGNIKSNSKSAGGIVNTNRGSLVCYCANEGSVNAQYIAGGITAFNDGEIYGSFNTGRVSGVTHNDEYHYEGSGGIAGVNANCIVNSYNTGEIIGCYRAGGISGLITTDGEYSKDFRMLQCYNIGKISATASNVTERYYGGVFGEINHYNKDVPLTISCCYTNEYPRYGEIFSYEEYYTIGAMEVIVNMKDPTQMPVIHDNPNWDTDENINDGYPYLLFVENVYDYNRYNVNVYDGALNNSIIGRSFSNVEGIIYGESSDYNAFVGGIAGFSSENENSIDFGKNLIVIADRISSKSKLYAYSGDTIGLYSDNHVFDNVFAYSSIDLTANNPLISGNVKTNNLASARTLSQLKRESFLKTVYGPNVYQSLNYLNEDETAVWVVEEGKLPELYYNLLNDISISSDVVNGSVTVDKTQAVDGELVTVTAVANDGYVTDKIYVNGEEITGNTFEMSGESVVYATFAPKKAEYEVKVTQSDNASASLLNADSEISLMSVDESTLTACDGEEIHVNVSANEKYTVDAIYVNDEIIAGDSFIVDNNSTVSLSVSSIDTEVYAVTNDVDVVGSFYVEVSGSLSNAGDDAVRYIEYWENDNSDEKFTTEILNGEGEYRCVLYPLKSSTAYSYRMLDSGEIKTFTTSEYVEEEPAVSQPVTTTTFKTLTSTYKFYVESAEALSQGHIIVAGYAENGRMISLDYTACDGDTSYTVSLPLDPDLYFVKIYIWDSINGLKPFYVPETLMMK